MGTYGSPELYPIHPNCPKCGNRMSLDINRDRYYCTTCNRTQKRNAYHEDNHNNSGCAFVFVVIICIIAAFIFAGNGTAKPGTIVPAIEHFIKIGTLNTEGSSYSQETLTTYNDIYKQHIEKNWSAINLYYSYHIKTNSAKTSCQLRRINDKCTFYYHGEDGDFSRDFIISKYDELERVLLSSSLEPYQLPARENGELIYLVEPILMVIYDGEECLSYAIKVPDSIGKIESFFKRLKYASKPPSPIH